MLRLRASMLWAAISIAAVCALGSASASARFHHPRLKSVHVTPHEVTGGSAESVTGTVRLEGPAPAGGEVVTLACDAPPTVSVPTSVVVPQGDSSATFAVSTSQVLKDTEVRISAGLNGEVRHCYLRVKRFDVVSFSFNPSTIKGGSIFTGFQSTAGTVVISAPAGPSGIVVQLSSDTNGTSLTNAITVPAGATSVVFALIAGSVTSTEVVHMTASIGFSQKTTKLTIVPAG